MGFLTPKLPPAPKPPNPAINPAAPKNMSTGGYSSLVSSSVSPGLSRKANKDKVSLIGGG